MEREHLYLPGDRDAVSDPIKLKGGTAALLFIRGNRPTQQDALWAAEHEGKLIVCSSDGVFNSDRGEEMAIRVVEAGRESAKKQSNSVGTVDVLEMQRYIRDAINRRDSLHRGQATALCMAIDAPMVQAHRVGNPDFRIDEEFLVHPALVPENRGFRKFRTWWEGEGARDLSTEAFYRLGAEKGRLLMNPNDKSAAVLENCHSGFNTDNSEAFISPWAAELVLKPGQRLVAGADGLENIRLNAWYQRELPTAFSPQHLLTDLWAWLENHNGENASGVAFFCDR